MKSMEASASSAQQVREKDTGALQNADQVQGLPGVIAADLCAQFRDALLNLLARQENLQAVADRRQCAHVPPRSLG